MRFEDVLLILGAVTLLSPLLLVACLGLPGLLGMALSEKRITFLTSLSVLSGIVAACSILGCMIFTGVRLVELNVGNWSVIPEEHFHFTVNFVFDRLSIPFSNWLPRAMEGPTPSSAVFYGALSVHLTAFLLLRISPILEQSLVLRLVVGALGLSTAIFATVTDRVQTDIKSALAYASLTQVGIIFLEIACGFYYLALIHIIGHAFLRTLQLVRAPSLLRDYAIIENAIGRDLAEVGNGQSTWLPSNLKNRVFVFALYRGYLDEGIHRFVIGPFLSIFRKCDAWERAWTDWLGGVASRESDEVIGQSSSIEELQ